jgi:uncharacterized protein (DUF362 family)
MGEWRRGIDTMRSYPPGCCGITRRGLLLGAGAGLVAGGALGWLAHRGWRDLGLGQELLSPFTGRTVEVPQAPDGMPGPFPGRVIEVRHPHVVSEHHKINEKAVSGMMARGMCELTGADHPTEAWRRFFEPGDVVGVKVNPVGRKPKPSETDRAPGAIGCISSPPVLAEVVNGLKSAGVRPGDIIIFERYANEFRDAGYEDLLRSRPFAGVRWYASSAGYSDTQLAIDGHDSNAARDPHVLGYDPDVFVSMGFAFPDTSPRDDRRYRSHLSAIITRMCNKIVTIPCLKDHRSAGVTLALKNLSHGMNNNVARSHLPAQYRASGRVSGPNQCNTFIPTAVAQGPLRRKATLHIMDGLIGVYEGGPGSWNRSWGTWRRQSLFFATDPVAMDHVCWDIIDNRRLLEGWAPVGHMGMLSQAPARTFSPRLAALALTGPEGTLAALGRHQEISAQPISEQFDRRQPEHVIRPVRWAWGCGTLKTSSIGSGGLARSCSAIGVRYAVASGTFFSPSFSR